MITIHHHAEVQTKTVGSKSAGNLTSKKPNHHADIKQQKTGNWLCIFHDAIT